MINKTYRAAKIRSASFNADDNTIDVVWTTGATVRRTDWDGTEYDEVLSLEPGAVRLDRLNAGAPFLDTHSDGSLANVLGSVVPGSARIEGGKGLAKVNLSRAASDADTVQKIKDGVIRNISVGYWTHASTRSDGDPPVVTATDWEPLEISAVPIPADPGSQIRSATGRRARPRTETEAGAAMARRALGKDGAQEAGRKAPAPEQRDLEAGAAMARRALRKSKSTAGDFQAGQRMAKLAAR